MIEEMEVGHLVRVQEDLPQKTNAIAATNMGTGKFRVFTTQIQSSNLFFTVGYRARNCPDGQPSNFNDRRGGGRDFEQRDDYHRDDRRGGYRGGRGGYMSQ